MFRTEIEIKPSAVHIKHQHQLLLMGSCFSDSIGKKLAEHKFHTLINPFGTLFHPVAIHSAITSSIENTIDPDLFFTRDNIWLHGAYHSQLFDVDKEKLIQTIQNQQATTHQIIRNADWLMLTYGTAFLYHIKSNAKWVANCHKMPANFFDKQLSSLTSLEKDFDLFYQHIKKLNPKIKVLLTISPVRHTRDTLELNQVSKASLRCFVHNVTQQHKDVHYFPAYEIMMDDLRDYRFYDRDLIHPNETAIDYIFEKFSQTFFSDDTQKLMNEWQTLKRELAHKAFHPSGKQHQHFLQNLSAKLQNLDSRLDVREELKQVEKQIIGPHEN
ncbi:MAG: GSCFA domain-containing protein [Chryseotalea sp.]